VDFSEHLRAVCHRELDQVALPEVARRVKADQAEESGHEQQVERQRAAGEPRERVADAIAAGHATSENFRRSR
jgi:hypothetical protein